MKFLILSCNTGGGHNAAALAVKKAAEKRGHEAVFMDYLMLSGEKTSKKLSSLYINTAKYLPHFFGFVYMLGKGVSYIPGKSPIYFYNKRLASPLLSYIKENEIDAVVVTHLYPAEALTCLKRRAETLPVTVAVATDYTCIPFWDEIELDVYVSPHEDLIGEYVKRKLPKEKIFPFGIPVDDGFSVEKPKAELKKEFGFDPDRPLYLIMSGSMGFGHVPMFAKLLMKHTENSQVAIICGNNEKMKKKLEKSFENSKDVRVIGFTKRVSDYMAACDVVYTKPGGLTSTEALVRNTPIIHTAPIPGCESRNYRFFGKRGMSIHAKNMVTQIFFGKMLVENSSEREKMIASQIANSKPDAAENIVKTAEKEFAASKERKDGCSA